jgi:1,4-alpha-glucan branching enzyme
MEQLEKNSLRSDRPRVRALHQAKRELLLAEASDWAFMMSSHTMLEYANTRTKTHLLNFNRLSDQIANRTIDELWLAELEARDCIFSADVLSDGTADIPTVGVSG